MKAPQPEDNNKQETAPNVDALQSELKAAQERIRELEVNNSRLIANQVVSEDVQKEFMARKSKLAEFGGTLDDKILLEVSRRQVAENKFHGAAYNYGH